ncbi:hypothetical protein P873_02600 [Arenimonas composti TR7-09 = DSM 18010]|uniref:Uncharacterized protein n=1 Tax=Arenimonas composti TR7-09 = DSM 18010 TaxID=1121013 RepID=A0A091BIX9_9GAMM|nr:hypothetical protein P873_02600 [Arenimonas composti TR7-09 = DSM 18010]
MSRYWHTLRWLKPVQIYGRAWFRLARPRPDQSPPPALRIPATHWQRCARAASMTGPRRLRFLGVERELAGPGDWNRADWPKLWLYNAHYFDDLAADDADARAGWHRELMRRWIAENPPPAGNGWEPYPASLRIVNWIKWALAVEALAPEAVHSLAVQARFLRRRLEIHLLGNHLWANAKGLLFAGAFFSGDEAAGWLRKGAAILRHELDEQILADGGHFERSPMYHAILLEDVLDLLQLDRAFPGALPVDLVATLAAAAPRMLRWLRVMSHPDGEIAFFNDAAFGIAPRLAELQAYAAALGIAFDTAPLAEIEALPDSGYVRLQAGPAVLIADIAPVGPDYIPGHAHADTLSFELSLHGRRALVNGGISTYDAGPLRHRQRRTAAHNTVTVDGADSSEVWGAFRVARRARPFDVAWRREGDTLVVHGAHDGYRRLPGRVYHARTWRLDEHGLEVRDALTGRFSGATARFRFAPTDPPPLTWSSSAPAAIEAGAWYPRFGAESSCEVLTVHGDGPAFATQFAWTRQ